MKFIKPQVARKKILYNMIFARKERKRNCLQKCVEFLEKRDYGREIYFKAV
jgi:hypothetical protein